MLSGHLDATDRVWYQLAFPVMFLGITAENRSRGKNGSHAGLKACRAELCWVAQIDNAEHAHVLELLACG